MELRQLEAFVAVATELHFGRAAEKLYLSQPTLSELVRRLERELGTPLLTRTTRRVTLTAAGVELLARSKVILDEVAEASAAVRRIAEGDSGTVRVGITPPVAPILGPHLARVFAEVAPDVVVVFERMWLPILTNAVLNGDVDVALTCGQIPEPAGVVGEVFCAEPVLVGLRPGHRLADAQTVSLEQLRYDVLGNPRASLFPAWSLSQQQILTAAGIDPPSVELIDTDLSAARWMEQPDIDWIMLTGSVAAAHTSTVIKTVQPRVVLPFTLQWSPSRASNVAVTRFVHTALSATPPPGWTSQPATSDHRSD
jgi:DNA-binding transcriptional LysR family regulator